MLRRDFLRFLWVSGAVAVLPMPGFVREVVADANIREATERLLAAKQAPAEALAGLWRGNAVYFRDVSLGGGYSAWDTQLLEMLARDAAARLPADTSFDLIELVLNSDTYEKAFGWVEGLHDFHHRRHEYVGKDEAHQYPSEVAGVRYGPIIPGPYHHIASYLVTPQSVRRARWA